LTFNINDLIDLKHSIYDSLSLSEIQRSEIEYAFDMMIKSKQEPKIPDGPIFRGLSTNHIPMPGFPGSSGTIKC